MIFKDYEPNISFSLGVISFISIGPAYMYFTVVEYRDNQNDEDANSINESYLEVIDKIVQIEEQNEQIPVMQNENQEPVTPVVPKIFINGVDPEDQQSESSLGTYRTKTSVIKSSDGLERILEIEKNQKQLIHEITTMKTMIFQISEKNLKYSGNKSTRF